MESVYYNDDEGVFLKGEVRQCFKRLNRESGLAAKQDNIFKYEYHIKDHLGNVRVIFTDDNNDGITERKSINDYYSFGMEWNNKWEFGDTLSPENKYRYNGKEFVEEMGWDNLMYGARFYNPTLGIFHSVDPLAQMYPSMSPYNYVMNNPISYIDPDGRSVVKTEDRITYTGQDAVNVFKQLQSRSKASNENGGDPIKPVTDANKKNISAVSWGETSGLYPLTQSNPTNKQLNDPNQWDAYLLDQLLKARAAIKLIADRNTKRHSANPNLKNAIQKMLAAYHLTDNFPEVDTEIKDDSAVKYFYLSSDENARTPSISSKYWDQEKVKTYGPFYNIGGGDAAKGATYIHFYKAVEKKKK